MNRDFFLLCCMQHSDEFLLNMGATVVDREEAEVIYHNASWGGCSHTKPQLTCDAEAVSYSCGHLVDENRFTLAGVSGDRTLLSPCLQHLTQF